MTAQHRQHLRAADGTDAEARVTQCDDVEQRQRCFRLAPQQRHVGLQAGAQHVVRHHVQQRPQCCVGSVPVAAVQVQQGLVRAQRQVLRIALARVAQQRLGLVERTAQHQRKGQRVLHVRRLRRCARSPREQRTRSRPVELVAVGQLRRQHD